MMTKSFDKHSSPLIHLVRFVILRHFPDFFFHPLSHLILFLTPGKGFISSSDFKEAMHDVAPLLKDSTVRLAFSQIDISGRSRVSYRQFYDMIRVGSARRQAVG